MDFSQIICRLLSVVCALILVNGAHAAAPKVTKAVPGDGEKDVDPGLKEIRFEFDQDMDQDIGYSICGGGPTFPKLVGKPQWIDKRLFTWRVKLKPNHDYVMNINCPNSFRNFRSVTGQPAAQYLIRFSTGPTRGNEGALTLEENRESVAELRRLIDENYSYRDLRGIDWDALFAKRRKKLENAKTPDDFARRTGRMLANATDLHIWLSVDEAVYGSYQRKVKPNYSLSLLAGRAPGWREHNSNVASARFAEGIGYILIKSWSREREHHLKAAYEALDAFADTKGLIIDVRPNSGGDEMLAREFAGCFVTSPVVYSKNVYRLSGAPGGFGEVYDRVLVPNPDRTTFKGKVAVLMGPENMSSCESFLLMMKQVPGCKLVGGKSYGSSGNPQPYNLPNGVTVYLPSWKDMLPDGTLLEGQGVQPDVPVKVTKRDIGQNDPVLQAALSLLQEQP